MSIDDTQEQRIPRQQTHRQPTHRTEHSAESSRRSASGSRSSGSQRRSSAERAKRSMGTMGTTGTNRAASTGTAGRRTANAAGYRSHDAQQYAHSAPAQRSRSASAAAAKVKAKQKSKKRITVAVAALAGLVLLIVLILNLPLISYTVIDHTGHETTTKISMMQKFRNWKPFVEQDGELESKVYDMELKKEVVEGVKDGLFDDGLDLDQIQEGQFSVLFLGTDESRSNTDVIMLAMFDIRGNEIHILQIPRDTFVPGFTSFEAGKLNSVYSLGNPNKQPVQRVVDCLETVFKVPIDRYVTTSCGDIAEIVDIIGGVPIDMPYTITYEADKIINEGKQVLNGQQAEWMVRFRHDYTEGDIGRMKAQRIFMAAAMAKVCDINSIEMFGYIDKIVDRQLIGSNLTVDEISKLSDFASTIGMDKITMHMLPGEGYNYYPPNPQTDIEFYSVWLMHKPPVTDLLNKYFRPYFEPENDLAIAEMLKPEEYKSTLYDEDMTDFQSIEDGDTFMGT